MQSHYQYPNLCHTPQPTDQYIVWHLLMQANRQITAPLHFQTSSTCWHQRASPTFAPCSCRGSELIRGGAGTGDGALQPPPAPHHRLPAGPHQSPQGGLLSIATTTPLMDCCLLVTASLVDCCLLETASLVDWCLLVTASLVDWCLLVTASLVDWCLLVTASLVDCCLLETASLVDWCLLETASLVDCCLLVMYQHD
jgi:hypothetical protein